MAIVVNATSVTANHGASFAEVNVASSTTSTSAIAEMASESTTPSSAGDPNARTNIGSTANANVSHGSITDESRVASGGTTATATRRVANPAQRGVPRATNTGIDAVATATSVHAMLVSRFVTGASSAVIRDGLSASGSNWRSISSSLNRFFVETTLQ